MESPRRHQLQHRLNTKPPLFLVIVALMFSTFLTSPSARVHAQREERAVDLMSAINGSRMSSDSFQNAGRSASGGILHATFEWEKYGIPKVAIKFNNLQLRKWIESENLRRCAVKANTENGKECTQFMIRTFLGEEAIPIEEAMESVARDRSLYHAFAQQEKFQNERIQTLEVQRGVLAVVAFLTTIALVLYVYTSRAAGLKIPVSALFSILTKKTADDVEDKAIRMRQVNEDAKARARRLEDAINNLKRNEVRV